MNMPLTALLTAPRRAGLLFALLAGLPALTSYGQITLSPYVSYQGFLTDAAGNPVGKTNAQTCTMFFRIWNSQTQTSGEMFGESQLVTVINGSFSVQLGQGSQIGIEPHPLLSNLFATSTYAASAYLETTVTNLGTGGGSIVLSPRLQYLAAPYAFLAANANTAGSLVNNANNPVVSILGSNVGINNSSPASTLTVNGTATVTGAFNSGAAAVTSLTNSGLSLLAGKVGIGVANPSASLEVGGAASFDNTLQVSSALTANGTLKVNGTLTAAGTANIVNLNTSGTVDLNAGANITGPLGVVGQTTLGSLSTSGQVYFYSTSAVPYFYGGIFMDAANGYHQTSQGSFIIDAANNNSGGRFTVTTGGSVGIGTASPQAVLDVEGSVTQPAINYGYLNGSGVAGHQYPNAIVPANGLSLKTSANILCGGEVDVTSDGRVKEIVRRSDTRQDLAMVRQLQMTDYRKLDKVQFGGRLEKGVIAQEVETIIPEAVSTSTNFIPNIYAPAQTFACTNGALVVTMARPHGLLVGDVVRLMTDTGKLAVTVTAVTSPREFTVAQPALKSQHLFVFGRQVGDFRAVNYDRLFTTGLGAIQELAKRTDELEAQKAQVMELKKEVGNLGEQMAEMKKLVTQLAEAAKDSKLAAAGSGVPVKTLASANLDR